MFCVLVAVIASAAKGPSTMQITYNNIKVMVDGAPVALKCEPFIMKDGSIGGSLTELAKALNKDVYYDTKSATLYIGRQPSGTWCYLSDLVPLQYVGEFIMNPAESGKRFSIAGQDYIKGIQMYSIDDYYIEFNLAGQFVRMTGEVGIDDDEKGNDGQADVFIYCDDALKYYKRGIEVGDFATKFSIDVTNVIKLKLRAADNIGYGYFQINWADVILER